MDRERDRRNEDNNEDGNGGFWGGAAVAAGVAALAGGLYYFSRGKNTTEQPVQSQTRTTLRSENRRRSSPPPQSYSSGPSQTLANLLSENRRRSSPPPQSYSSGPSQTLANLLSENRRRSSPPPQSYSSGPSQTLANLLSENRRRSSPPSQSYSSEPSPSAASTAISYFLDRLSIAAEGPAEYQSGGRIKNVPDVAEITNLDSLLSDIYVRYIAMRREDFELYYRIFDRIFHQLHRTMKDIDPYYERYSSTVSFAGSHYDKLRIKKPDEFDMDIVIGMPLNLSDNPLDPADSDIKFEPRGAGFVELKTGKQFAKLPMRDGTDWQINKTAYKWKDDDGYLQRSKFTDWFKSLVVRALNKFDKNASMCPVYTVDGVQYCIGRTESGPAITLKIVNTLKGFKMDVDLVPALRFPERRWPLNNQYRDIPPSCKKDYWMVVPKPDKNDPNDLSRISRSWRIALHNQERELMYNCYNLKQTIRLIKKLRDAQGMNKIASYYIKTLFFWEVVKQDNTLFWRKSVAELFKIMVQRFHKAMCDGEIPYFWNKNNNLIAGVGRFVVADYREKLAKLLYILEDPVRYKTVAKFLLTPIEFNEYNRKFLHI